MELVFNNSLGAEIGRFPVERDDLGYPLMLATLAENVELREAFDNLQPGDSIRFDGERGRNA